MFFVWYKNICLIHNIYSRQKEKLALVSVIVSDTGSSQIDASESMDSIIPENKVEYDEGEAVALLSSEKTRRLVAKEEKWEGWKQNRRM